MEKMSSAFKKIHGLQKSYHIHMRGRMGKFRSPVWKTTLAVVHGASVYQARLFTWALREESLEVSEQEWGLDVTKNSPKPLINTASGHVPLEISMFQFKTSWTSCIAQKALFKIL